MGLPQLLYVLGLGLIGVGLGFRFIPPAARLQPRVFDTAARSTSTIGEKFKEFVSGITSTPISATKYNSSMASIIVDEYFPFRDRETEARVIVKRMLERQKYRAEAKAPMDKRCNPMVFIPGSPGIGKSAFLVHFPESEAFQTYVSQLEGPGATSVGRPPIVAPLTFNSAMSHHVQKGNDVIPTLGLRMLYGAAASMSSPGSKVPLWEDFAEDFQQYLEGINADVSAKTAAKVLREVYGRERRLLVLVDEVSKARPSGQADANVMTELGDLLESDGTVDVLVSSLSAKYVAELLSGSNRKLQYVVMTPLLHSRLGEPETQRWSEELLQQTSQGRSVDAFVVKLLLSTHLLCSGYPRSLERLVVSYNLPGEWSVIPSLLKDDPKCSVTKVLPALADEVWGISRVSSTPTIEVPAALGYVLSATAITADDDTSTSISSSLTELVEKGAVFLVSQSRKGDPVGPIPYQVSMTLAQFLRIMNAVNPDLFPPVGKVAWELFNPLLDQDSNFGTWFERSVALTAIVRSMERLEIAKGVKVPPLTLKKASTEAELRKALANDDDVDVLILPPENNPGFDMVVAGKKEAGGVRYYLQCKAAKSTRHTHLREVARCILNTVQKHMELLEPPGDLGGSGTGAAETKRWTVARQREELAKIKIVFFRWVQEELKLSADEVRKALESIIAAKKKSENKTDDMKKHSADGDGKKKKETKYTTSIVENGGKKMEESVDSEDTTSVVEKMSLAFVDSYFETSFLCTSGLSLRQWLLPVLEPVPGLVSAIVEPEEAE
eukprot:gene26170-31600_t